MSARFIQVTTTTARREDADKIARRVVERRLAACAQVAGPVTSTYWWEGALETADEWLVVMKTRAELFDALEAAVRAAHPYETPEMVAVDITAGSAAYLEWIADETRRD